MSPQFSLFFFFFNDTATTEIYTLSLHDALPILSATRSSMVSAGVFGRCRSEVTAILMAGPLPQAVGSSPASDRKSTRLNSSHLVISYAVFCLKKKNKLLSSSSVSLNYTLHQRLN